MAAKNVFIAQSGGPSAVINNSMRGVIDALIDSDEFRTIYTGSPKDGAPGILGALEEKLLGLSEQNPIERALLEVTPCAGQMGTSRYKLPKVDIETLLEKVRGIDINKVDVSKLDEDVQDYVRLIQVFKAHDIGYFFYCGGNDSMDTSHKLNEVAKALKVDLKCVGVPKTIDNDVGDSERLLVDHTPGFGSTANYWRNLVQSANEENGGSYSSDPVLLMQVMGRKVGYLPAAARLADPKREMPLAIILTEMLKNEIKIKGNESDKQLEEIAQQNQGIAAENYQFIERQIKRSLREYGRTIVVTSEGTYIGDLGLSKDAFGHKGYSTGIPVVAQIALNLNSPDGLLKRMKIPGSARSNIPGTDQRGFIGAVAAQDLIEAYQSGRYAVEIVLNEDGGYMATIKRGIDSNGDYKPIYDKVPLEVVAAVDRKFPSEWIDRENADVTDDVIAYAGPLARTDFRLEKEFQSAEQFLNERDAIRAEIPLSVVLPIINGKRRFAQFEPICASKQLAPYVPVGMR